MPFAFDTLTRNGAAMLCVLIAIVALATPQPDDTLKYGDHTFAIREIPMLGLWDYGEGEPPHGKVKPPLFDFAGSGNWAGYEAKWRIRDSTLFLDSMTAKRGGKRIKNEQIFPGERFPLKAEWFTGRIHLPVGGYNEADQVYESVIVCHIENGTVVKMTFETSLRYTFGWNGLPQVEAEVK